MSQWVVSTLNGAHSLHPHLLTSVQVSGQVPPASDCHLELIYPLPPSVFVDPHQLLDLYSYATVYGEVDLEAPLEHVQETPGSVVHLPLPVQSTPLQSTLSIDLPLHLRYQSPAQTQYQPLHLPQPIAGWRCGPLEAGFPPSLSDVWTLLPTNTSMVTFEPLQQPQDPLVLGVPVGDKRDTLLVEVGTLTSDTVHSK
ncbi:PIG-X [Spinellus fusiger]|nr:PIG-X [Spinellus fusiger]